MKDSNCFPPAEYNPSSLPPTSLSQSLMAKHELLYHTPQLSLPVPSGSQEMMYLLLTPATAPLPNAPRTFSSGPHCSLICALFACLPALSGIANICLLFKQTPSTFTLHPAATPRPVLPAFHQLSDTHVLHVVQSWLS